ncbi:MAG: GNAT family N-acetyltransferase [Planctomycetes bacterium]|nr:GNAT family N-acetyltransferase [Planctomycetota bacterium]
MPELPLGPDCRVGRLSETHQRSHFRCGVDHLDNPILTYRLDGPRIDREILVATLNNDNRVVGYGGLELSDLELAQGITGMAFYVPWIAVAQGFQRRGIGKRLVSEVLLRAQRWSREQAITAPVTLHAEKQLHGFYEQFGFEQINDQLLALPASVLTAL